MSFLLKENERTLLDDTITHIAFCPLADLGNPTTKSVAIFSHFHSGMSNGFNNPAGLWCSALTYWHTMHFATNEPILLFIFLHQNVFRRSRYIFVPPGCMAYGVEWAFSNISFLKTSSFGTQILPLNISAWSEAIRKSFLLSVPILFLIFCKNGSLSCASMIRSLRVGQTTKVAKWAVTCSSVVIASICNFSKSLINSIQIVGNDANCPIDFLLRASATT